MAGAVGQCPPRCVRPRREPAPERMQAFEDGPCITQPFTEGHGTLPASALLSIGSAISTADAQALLGRREAPTLLHRLEIVFMEASLRRQD